MGEEGSSGFGKQALLGRPGALQSRSLFPSHRPGVVSQAPCSTCTTPQNAQCESGALHVQGLTGNYPMAGIRVILFAEPRWKIRPGWRIYFCHKAEGGALQKFSVWKQSWLTGADSQLILCTPLYHQASNSQRILQYSDSNGK